MAGSRGAALLVTAIAAALHRAGAALCQDTSNVTLLELADCNPDDCVQGQISKDASYKLAFGCVPGSKQVCMSDGVMDILTCVPQNFGAPQASAGGPCKQDVPAIRAQRCGQDCAAFTSLSPAGGCFSDASRQRCISDGYQEVLYCAGLAATTTTPPMQMNSASSLQLGWLAVAAWAAALIGH